MFRFVFFETQGVLDWFIDHLIFILSKHEMKERKCVSPPSKSVNMRMATSGGLGHIWTWSPLTQQSSFEILTNRLHCNHFLFCLNCLTCWV